MIKGKKDKNGRKRTKRVQTVIFAVVLAIAAWFLVNIVDDPETTVTIADTDVRFKNEYALKGQGIVLTGKRDIPSISVTLRGRRSNLMDYMNDVYVEADTAQITNPGEYELSGTVIVPSNSGITVDSTKYDAIPVTAEKLESKEVKVEINHTGANKTKIIKSEAASPAVIVTGAKNELDEVASAVASVDISEITEDNTLDTGFILVDRDGNYITQNETLETTTAEITVLNTVYTAKTVKIEPELNAELSNRYILDKNAATVTPDTVTVGITDGAAADSITLYIDKASAEAQEYTLQSTDAVYIPPENARVRVKAALLHKETKTLDVTAETENLASGLTASVEPVSVTVTGPEGELTAEGVKARVDAEGLAAGTYSLPIKFEGKNITASGSFTAAVTIQQNGG